MENREETTVRREQEDGVSEIEGACRKSEWKVKWRGGRKRDCNKGGWREQLLSFDVEESRISYFAADVPTFQRDPTISETFYCANVYTQKRLLFRENGHQGNREKMHTMCWKGKVKCMFVLLARFDEEHMAETWVGFLHNALCVVHCMRFKIASL